VRRPIILIITAGLLPIIALGGAFGFATLRAEHGAVRTGTGAMARFSAALAATKLGDGMRSVDMVAQSPAFDGRFDAERFRILAQRLRRGDSAWQTLSVADLSGRRLVDIPEPVGGILKGQVIDRQSLDEAVATGRPIVGNVVAGPRGRYAFAVRAPVIRNGRVLYVLSAVIPAEAVRPLLLYQQLPAGWRAAIVDRAGNLVASSAPNSTGIGKRVSLPGLSSRREGRPAFYNFVRRDGTSAVGTWAAIPGTSWSIHVSAPASAYAGPAQQALALLVAVAIASVLLLLALVRLLLSELRQGRARELAEVQGQRLEALGRITGGVAHDFNNLLTPIIGGLDIVRRRIVGDEKAAAYIDAGLASAERARGLVARLLSFARQQTLSPSDLNVNMLLNELKDLLQTSVGRTCTIAISVDDDLPSVHADRPQLELAILNLAINARDAMDAGGTVRITAEPATDELAAGLTKGSYVAISVADSGAGMDEATLRQATDPFFTTKPPGQGTGLGLSMVQGFAAQSGGVLHIRSAPGQGTVATIVLPAAAGQADPIHSSSTAAVREKNSGKILLVDDEMLVRQSTAGMLREAGYQVVEADSVGAALAILADDPAFDVVATDYAMPGQTGAELIAALQTRWPALPVLMITGYAEGAKDVGPEVARLSKPFRLEELIDAISAMIGNSGPD